ncbi:hypothetical protein BOMU111920_19910 [Bordetella muralis]
MNVSQQSVDQNGQPSGPDSDRPNQVPGDLPRKNAPGRQQPAPGDAPDPFRHEPKRPVRPNEPGKAPQPEA